ncbi:PD-(D/E)XK nuclease family protein [Acidithrix ferrooxidans]|uniref:ATP-dependent helicase/deoxyribonuclease subunit B n=1 Tax=Acidithrix ferrooxidans TaxID=1280514 RepID=A0A0D8HJH2_9ACTN|nr:PD-(D/E)XK nuclease family protein [Acidithrix ferrooxidans]KJF18093.1 ATP-dependent helicase/deoxyribonuclease subunit B [Acidithrix ferrooxidans]
MAQEIYLGEALERLIWEIDRIKGNSPMRGVTVIVPGGLSPTLISSKLATTRNLFNVEFLSILAFAKRSVAQLQLDGVPRIASALTAKSMLRSAFFEVKASNPSLYDRIAPDSETLSALERAIVELGGSDLGFIESGLGVSVSTRFCLDVYGSISRKLRKANLILESSIFGVAADVIGSSAPIAIEAAFGSVVLYAPHGLLASAFKMLIALYEKTPLNIIHLRSGIAEVDSRFSEVFDLLGSVGDGLNSEELPREIALSTSDFQEVSLADVADEVDYVVTKVLELLASGISISDIVVRYTNEPTYLHRLLERFSAARVPSFLSDASNLGTKPALVMAFKLVELCRNKRRSDLVSVLLDANLEAQSDNLALGDLVGVTISAKIDGDVFGWARDWKNRLETRGENSASKDEITKEILSDFLIRLDQSFSVWTAALSGRSWRDLAFATWKLLAVVYEKLPLLFEASPLDRNEIPREGVQEIVAGLAQVVGLDGDDLDERPNELGFWISLGHATPSTPSNFEIDKAGLRLELASSFSGLSASNTFVLGMTERFFPISPPATLLEERTRNILKLQRQGDRVAIGNRALALSIGMSQSVTLTYPRVDVAKAKGQFPSAFIEILKGSNRRSDRPLANTGVETIRSRFDLLEKIRVPINDSMTAIIQDLTPGELPERSRDQLSIYPRAPEPSTPLFSLVDISKLDLGVTRPLATTYVEDWLSCPFAFFAMRILRIREITEPETVLRLDPLVRGGILHEIFERLGDRYFQGRTLSSGGILKIDDSDLSKIVDEAWQHFEPERPWATSIYKFWRKLDYRTIQREAREFVNLMNKSLVGLVIEDDFRELGIEPTTLTMQSPFLKDLSVNLVGKMDRVIKLSDRSYIVIDYKTGSSQGYLSGKNLKPQKVQLVLYRQLLERYLMTSFDQVVDQVKLEYWFVSERRGISRFEVPAEAIDLGLQTSAIAIALIRDGLFLAGLHDYTAFQGGCSYCNPDGLDALRTRAKLKARLLSVGVNLGDDVPWDLQVWQSIISLVRSDL